MRPQGRHRYMPPRARRFVTIFGCFLQRYLLQMKLDALIDARDIRSVATAAAAAERVGFDALWATEAGNDPLLAMALAASHTNKVKLGTAVLVAFPRSPMTTAYGAWDLAALSRGRFILGLGTQVKGHIERRYGIKWEPPVPRMREYVESLRAIFKCWREGTSQLLYQGRYYNFSLMTPFFAPAPHEFWQIPIYVAGVNPLICKTAGELCDGLHAHPFNSPKYLRERVLPHVEAGLNKAGRRRQDFSIASGIFVITGSSRQEMERARESARQQIAFYASTRTYHTVLDTHGWGEVALRLHEQAARGDWRAMSREITDEMLDVFAVAGSCEEIGAKVKARYAGLLDRVALYTTFRPGSEKQRWRRLCEEFNA
jgi:probable F420-dependent oxidoreductase